MSPGMLNATLTNCRFSSFEESANWAEIPHPEASQEQDHLNLPSKTGIPPQEA
jgi:hypothetical protein